MAAADNIAKALSLKEEGNTCFKAGDYKGAMAAYHQIFMYVHGFSASSGGPMGMLPGQTTAPATPEEMKQIKELKLVHFNNLAMCHLKMPTPNLQKVRMNCTKALALDPNNVKALFRRGTAHAQLGMLDEAKADLDKVLDEQPYNNDALKERRALKALFQAQRAKEQKKFAGMFDKLQSEEDPSGQRPGAASIAGAGGAAAASGNGGGGAGSNVDERMKAVVPPTAGPKTEADSSNLDDLKALTKKAAKKLEAAEGSGGGPSQKFKIEKTLPSKLAEDKAAAAEKKRKEIEKAVAAAKAKQEAEKQKDAAKAAAAASSTAGDEEDEDIGEPLGSPQTFEPSDVQFKGGAVPVT